MAFSSSFSTRLIAIVLFSTLLFSAQAQQTMFKINYDVNNFDFPSKSRESLTPGNYIFAGWNTNFIPISSTLTEVNSSGNIVWSRRYSGSGLVYQFNEIKRDAASNTYYMCGGSESNSGMFMVTNATGTPTLTRNFSLSQGTGVYFNSIIKASDGGYVLVGYVTGYDPDGAGPEIKFNSITYTDVDGNSQTESIGSPLIVKFDASGNHLWHHVFRYYTTSTKATADRIYNDASFSDVVEVSDGYVAVGGYDVNNFRSATNSDGDDATPRDALFLKTTTAGAITYHRQIDAPSTSTSQSSKGLSTITKTSAGLPIISGDDGSGRPCLFMRLPSSGGWAAPTWIRKYGAGSFFGTFNPLIASNFFETSDGNYTALGSYIAVGLPPSFAKFILKVNPANNNVVFARQHNGGNVDPFPFLYGEGVSDGGFIGLSMGAGLTNFDFQLTKADSAGNIPADCPQAALSVSSEAPSYSYADPFYNSWNANTVSVTSPTPIVTTINPAPNVICRTIACSPKPATPTVSANPTTICAGQSTQITATGGSNVTYRVYLDPTGGTSVGTTPYNVSPTITTTYYVEADDNSNPGCVSATRGSVLVTVNQPPANVGAISGAVSPCPGSQNYTVGTVSGATSVVWSVTGGGSISTSNSTSATISWTGTGNQTITVTATNSCGTKTNTLAVNVQLAAPSTIGSISGNNNPCPGSQQYTIGNVAGATNYSWQLSGGGTITSGGATNTATVNWTTSGGPYTLTVTASNSCGQLQQTYTVNVKNGTPISVGTISGNNNPCPGVQTYTINNVPGATSYTWAISGGGTITGGQNTTSANITWTVAGQHTITVTATNDCGSANNTLVVNVQPAAPSTIGSISGNNNPCPGSQQYTIGNVAGATNYSWQLSGGGTITSGGATNTATVNWTTSGGPYTLTVTASNSCGQLQQTYTVNVKNGTPISVGTISGNNNPCPGVQTYTINNVPGATGYSWAISGGGNITGGQNTTSANITWTVAGQHTITVTATNDCGNASSTLTVNVKTPPPTSVPAITGTNNPCPGTQTYTITPVANASSYVWSVNNGGTITSGQGTTSIDVNWTTPGGLYTVSVVASNDCGNASNTLSISVQNPTPAAPTHIIGDTAVCAGPKLYSVTAVNFATTYTWAISGGGTISAGQGSTNININWATAGTYNVSVTASNTCGSSATTVKSVTVTEAAPTGLGTITGTQVVCKGNYNYTVGAATNGTTYNWTVGSPGTILSGQGTTTVSVNWKGTGTFPISVSAQNVCGSSASTSLNVTVSDTTPTPPVTITGSNQPCQGASTYTILNSANATGYTWTVSGGGGTILSGQGTTSINVDWATAGGPYTVAVSADNVCGSSVQATLQVTVLSGSAPVVGNITGDTAVCPSTETYSIAPVQNANGYQWTVTNGTIASGQGTTSISVTWATPGNSTVSVVATGACSNSLPKTLNVRVKDDKPGRPGSVIGQLSTCGSTTETYTISAVPNATNYGWGISGGGTITSGQGTTSIIVDWASSPGTYTLSVFAENDCGQSLPATIEVTVNPPAPVMTATIQGNNDICPGLSSYTITAIPNATSYTWTVSNGGNIVSGQGTTSLTVNWTTSGAQTVSVTATNACGTSSPATLSVNVKVSPTVPTATAQDATICEGSSTVLTGTNSLGGNVSYNFYDAETGGNLVGVSPLTVSPVTTTTYYLESVNEFGCRHSGTRVPATVTVVKAPTVLNLSTNNTSICYGDSTTLSATASQGATIVWWDAPLNGNQLGTGNTYTTNVLFETTSFYVSASTTGGCRSLEARKEIAVEVKPLPLVTLTSDKVENKILPQEKLVFTANPNGYAKYEFYVNGTLVQEGPENFYASAKFNDKDTVVVVAFDNGCRSVADTALVKVADFPNAFTPNTDGRNDAFLKDYDLVVYNRWGQELYKGIEGWDGTYNGKKVSPGTYFYIVELENITDKNTIIKGTVLLIQE